MALKITGLNEVIDFAKKMPDAVRFFEPKATKKAGDFLAGRVRDKWPEDTGFSKRRINSFFVKKTKDQSLMQVGFNPQTSGKNIEYAETIEFGRSPNSSFPPLDSITFWLGGKKQLQKEMIRAFHGERASKILAKGVINRSSTYESLNSYLKGLVHVIGDSIRRKGTDGVFAFKQTAEKDVPDALKIYDQELDRFFKTILK